ncbi:MAG TPA: DNA mismatch repair protein MutT [Bacteroidales bacterium]|jgi:8-oxo-dGTP diphosphatase|nr:DNA mismatch repair protein MutT [Bacteroidales bacterium]
MNTILYKDQYRHLLAIDCIIFGYSNEELKLLLFHREIMPAQGQWSLVGGFVNENESVEDAANRVLEGITGLKNIYMEQVSVFSKTNRDPGGHVVSVVFNALIDIEKHNPDLVRDHGAHWWPISKLPNLIFDHGEMVKQALGKLRNKAGFNLIVGELLPKEFTITQLRRLYNNIFQREFDPGNFRKKILSLGILERLNKKDLSDSKKGAYYYKIKEGVSMVLNERIVKE